MNPTTLPHRRAFRGVSAVRARSIAWGATRAAVH